MSDYYDKQGKPLDTIAWCKLFEDWEYKRVASDYVGDVQVSTVWLGSDHSYGNGPILIFETMVFGGPLDEEQVRYTTEAEAIAGHAAMLARVHAAAKEQP